MNEMRWCGGFKIIEVIIAYLKFEKARIMLRSVDEYDAER